MRKRRMKRPAPGRIGHGWRGLSFGGGLGLGGIGVTAGASTLTLATTPDRLLWLDGAEGVNQRGAAAFNGTTQLLEIESPDSALQVGSGDLLCAAWVRFDAFGVSPHLFRKFSALSPDAIDYHVFYNTGVNRFRFRLDNDSGGFQVVDANTFGAASTGVWHFVAAYYDKSRQVVGISVNGGTADEAAFTGTPLNDTDLFTVGATWNGVEHSGFIDGAIDQVVVCKGTDLDLPGLIADLYNGGAGRSAAEAPASATTFYDLDELSGTRFDAIGTNHLADTTTATAVDGIVEGTTADGGPVSVWADKINGLEFEQIVIANRPSWDDGGWINLDGTNDGLDQASPLLSVADASTTLIYHRVNTLPGSGEIDVLYQESDGDGDPEWTLGVDEFGSYVFRHRPVGAGSAVTVRSATGSAIVGVDHVVALRIDGAEAKLYVDGLRSGLAGTISTGRTMTGASIRVGGPVASGYAYTDGRIYGTWSTARALTDAQILDLSDELAGGSDGIAQLLGMSSSVGVKTDGMGAAGPVHDGDVYEWEDSGRGVSFTFDGTQLDADRTTWEEVNHEVRVRLGTRGCTFDGNPVISGSNSFHLAAQLDLVTGGVAARRLLFSANAPDDSGIRIVQETDGTISLESLDAGGGIDETITSTDTFWGRRKVTAISDVVEHASTSGTDPATTQFTVTVEGDYGVFAQGDRLDVTGTAGSLDGAAVDVLRARPDQSTLRLVVPGTSLTLPTAGELAASPGVYLNHHGGVSRLGDNGSTINYGTVRRSPLLLQIVRNGSEFTFVFGDRVETKTSATFPAGPTDAVLHLGSPTGEALDSPRAEFKSIKAWDRPAWGRASIADTVQVSRTHWTGEAAVWFDAIDSMAVERALWPHHRYYWRVKDPATGDTLTTLGLADMDTPGGLLAVHPHIGHDPVTCPLGPLGSVVLPPGEYDLELTVVRPLERRYDNLYLEEGPTFSGNVARLVVSDPVASGSGWTTVDWTGKSALVQSEINALAPFSQVLLPAGALGVQSGYSPDISLHVSGLTGPIEFRGAGAGSTTLDQGIRLNGNVDIRITDLYTERTVTGGGTATVVDLVSGEGISFVRTKIGDRTVDKHTVYQQGSNTQAATFQACDIRAGQDGYGFFVTSTNTHFFVVGCAFGRWQSTGAGSHSFRSAYSHGITISGYTPIPHGSFLSYVTVRGWLQRVSIHCLSGRAPSGGDGLIELSRSDGAFPTEAHLDTILGGEFRLQKIGRVNLIHGSAENIRTVDAANMGGRRDSADEDNRIYGTRADNRINDNGLWRRDPNTGPLRNETGTYTAATPVIRQAYRVSDTDAFVELGGGYYSNSQDASLRWEYRRGGVEYVVPRCGASMARFYVGTGDVEVRAVVVEREATWPHAPSGVEHASNWVTLGAVGTSATADTAGGLVLRLEPTAGVNQGGAAAFNGTTQFLEIESPDSALQVGSGDLLCAAWVRFDAFGVNPHLFRKYSALSPESIDYHIFYNTGVNRFRFRLDDNTGSFEVIDANTFGAASTGVWHFVAAYYDKSRQVVGISVDGGTADEAAFTGTPLNDTDRFTVGATWDGVAYGGFVDGAIDQVVVCKGTDLDLPGLIADLYNGGAGRSAAEAPASATTFYELDELSGTRFDSIGTNHLADTTTATVTDGIVEATTVDGDQVADWDDQEGAARFSQATSGLQPTYRDSPLAIRFDGTDDQLTATTVALIDRHVFTLYLDFTPSAIPGSDPAMLFEAGADGAASMRAEVTSDGTLRFVYKPTGGIEATAETPVGSIAAATRVVATLVREAGRISVRLDGQPATQLVPASGLCDFLSSSTRIGGPIQASGFAYVSADVHKIDGYAVAHDPVTIAAVAGSL